MLHSIVFGVKFLKAFFIFKNMSIRRFLWQCTCLKTLLIFPAAICLEKWSIISTLLQTMFYSHMKWAYIVMVFFSVWQFYYFTIVIVSFIECNYIKNNYLPWLLDGVVLWVGETLSLQTLVVISANGSSSLWLIKSNSVTK